MPHPLTIAAAGALALAGLAAPAPVHAYPIDCAILLCMAGGFPSDPVCTAAYAEMIRRVTPWPIEPPLQIWNCPMGASFDGPLQSLPEVHEAAFQAVPAAPEASPLLWSVQTPGADVDISGPAFDFVRSLRVYHRHVTQYEDRGDDARGDRCRRETDVTVGTYDSQGRFDWDEASMSDFPAAFVPYRRGGCSRGRFGSVFIDWRDNEGNYGFEQVNY